MNTKKILSLLLILCMCLALAACGTAHADPEPEPETEEQTAPPSSPGKIIITEGSLDEVTCGSSISFMVSKDYQEVDVSWSIQSNTSKDTTIDQEGKLTIAKDETAEVISVIAVSKKDVNENYLLTVPIPENKGKEKETEKETKKKEEETKKKSKKKKKEPQTEAPTEPETYNPEPNNNNNNNNKQQPETYNPKPHNNNKQQPDTNPQIEPATTHQHQHVASVVPATCTSGGYTVFTCNCGDSYISNYTNPLGHSWQYSYEMSDDGKIMYENRYCTRCGELHTKVIK